MAKPLAPLTGLRVVAACSVLIAHALDTAFIYDPKNFHPYAALLAYFGMSLFFVLSGFVIQYNYAESFRTEPLRGIPLFRCALRPALTALCDHHYLRASEHPDAVGRLG